MVEVKRTRRATIADAPFVAAHSDISEATLHRRIEEGSVWVVEEAGAPVGHGRVEYLWSKVPYLALIWIRPDRRGRRLGMSLLHAIEQELRGAGHRKLYSSSQADAARAQRWHRRAGFTECGYIGLVNADGVGEVFYRKPLRRAAAAE